MDLDGAALHIRRSIAEVDGCQIVKPPKSAAGRRSLALDSTTLAMLEAVRSEGWMFQLRDKPITPTALTQRFPRLVRRVDVKPITLHGLRHTYATIALEHCRTFADVKTLSRRLGHSSVQITLDRYSHALPAGDASLADSVAGAL